MLWNTKAYLYFFKCTHYQGIADVINTNVIQMFSFTVAVHPSHCCEYTISGMFEEISSDLVQTSTFDK